LTPYSRKRRQEPEIVLLAERFDSAGDDAFRDQVVEIADLCAQALARAAELDRFPVRTLLRLSDRWQALREPRRGARALAIAATIAAVVAALALLPADFDVEAPATLAAAVERQVFATATGAVAEVRVAHGDMVELGQTLIVLRDPELALKLQEVRGEIDATRKRLEAIAVARTERTLREDQDDQRLPLSAEQRELEERLATLQLQAKLLEARRKDLEIRSPVAGQVLTRDVQSLLASRPVERGQVLLTIADSSAGWELRADVPQRKIGHVVAARQEQSEPLAADYRLAGDVSRSYPGRVVAVSAAAPLDADGLQDDDAPVEVRIALVGDPPPAARSGMTANVRIHCGSRSLAYVWLHDPAATIYRWFTF
jgi:biotin carboxyl carrier protein